MAISTDTASDDVFHIQGMLIFSAFDDRSRSSEHPDSVFTVSDVCIELQTYSRNVCAYAKETANAPSYMDICDTSGARRQDGTLITVGFETTDKKWRAGARGSGYGAPVSCAFGLGIPMHLFRSAKERYFRITARIELEVGPRHPLTYTSAGACKPGSVQLAYAASDPVEFTVSHLTLPRSDSP